jgi:hypothetical protein
MLHCQVGKFLEDREPTVGKTFVLSRKKDVCVSSNLHAQSILSRQQKINLKKNKTVRDRNQRLQ